MEVQGHLSMCISDRVDINKATIVLQLFVMSRMSEVRTRPLHISMHVPT